MTRYGYADPYLPAYPAYPLAQRVQYQQGNNCPVCDMFRGSAEAECNGVCPKNCSANEPLDSCSEADLDLLCGICERAGGSGNCMEKLLC